MVRNKLILLVGIGALAYGAYWGYGYFMTPAQQQGGFAMAVEAYDVVPQPLDVTIESVGTLRANESVTLRPELAGRITDILFTEGALLKKGTPLFKIDDRVYNAEVKQASANLQLAKLNFERFQKLSKTGASTRQRFDEAQANLGVAQANYDLARTRLDYATIAAPFDGTVGLRNISPGDFVSVGQDLANFVSYDPMKVDFNIPENQSRQLKAGQTIDITVEAVPGRTFAGDVFAIDPQIDVNGRAVALRATIANPDYLLKPGFFARVSLLVEKKESALLIPENAIVPQGNDKFVFKIKEDNTVTLVPVTLGIRKGGQVEITEGLSAGDAIVTSGQIKLREGAPVRRTDQAPADAAAAPKKE
ncbi:MAG: efflux RND transporter periplasmic adaptor subunit [Alphaproteobacteria bacterium]|nr:efflux RND transporter periplasmic adaptor subunit [Alphaproteobacteria bacterium]